MNENQPRNAVWDDNGEGLVVVLPDNTVIGIEADDTEQDDTIIAGAFNVGRLAVEDLDAIAQMTAAILHPVVTASAGCDCTSMQAAAMAAPSDGEAAQDNGPVMDESSAVTADLRSRLAALDERVAMLETDLATVIAMTTPSVAHI